MADIMSIAAMNLRMRRLHNELKETIGAARELGQDDAAAELEKADECLSCAEGQLGTEYLIEYHVAVPLRAKIRAETPEKALDYIRNGRFTNEVKISQEDMINAHSNGSVMITELEPKIIEEYEE